jgi:hypothetical protein
VQPIVNVIAVEVHEATGGKIETTAPQNMSLDGDIIKVVFLHVDRDFTSISRHRLPGAAGGDPHELKRLDA